MAAHVHMRPRMPQAHSNNFGALDYDLSAVLIFPNGLPGFEHARRFALVEEPRFAPALILQNLESAGLGFLVVGAEMVQPDYALAVTCEDLELLGLDPSQPPTAGKEVLCLVILSAPEDGHPTANLLAPVVVNLGTRVAVQAVRADSRYSYQHPILEDCARETTEGAACL